MCGGLMEIDFAEFDLIRVEFPFPFFENHSWMITVSTIGRFTFAMIGIWQQDAYSDLLTR